MISLFLPKFIWMRIETKHGILYFGKQYYFMINSKAIFLYTYRIASLGITKIYIFSKYFWSPCSTDENHFDFFFVGFFDHKHLISCWCTFENMFVCQIRDSEVWFAKKLGRHFLSDMIFFSWERLADTIFHKNRTTVKYQRKRNME